jgi:hypothetical protein
MSSLAAAVAVALEAKKRIDFPTRSGVTFFSVKDQWLYVAVLDGKTCDLCRSHEDKGTFLGNELRRTFPDLEVIDEDMIQVHAHLNCRCFLIRFIGEPE